ncbi:hypothetical protein Dimus_005136 [Dionaea muscipula]
MSSASWPRARTLGFVLELGLLAMCAYREGELGTDLHARPRGAPSWRKRKSSGEELSSTVDVLGEELSSAFGLEFGEVSSSHMAELGVKPELGPLLPSPCSAEVGVRPHPMLGDRSATCPELGLLAGRSGARPWWKDGELGHGERWGARPLFPLHAR